MLNCGTGLIRIIYNIFIWRLRSLVVVGSSGQVAGGRSGRGSRGRQGLEVLPSVLNRLDFDYRACRSQFSRSGELVRRGDEIA